MPRAHPQTKTGVPVWSLEINPFHMRPQCEGFLFASDRVRSTVRGALEMNRGKTAWRSDNCARPKRNVLEGQTADGHSENRNKGGPMAPFSGQDVGLAGLGVAVAGPAPAGGVPPGGTSQPVPPVGSERSGWKV